MTTKLDLTKEPESLAKMQKLMEEKNLVKNGPHHEIYLVMSYPKKISEENLKTILRQPVKISDGHGY